MHWSHLHPVMAEGRIRSAPSLRADRTINANQLNSPTLHVQLAPVDCQQGSNQVLKNHTGSLGAPTLMQLSHWACRIRHHGPISHYLSSSTASCIRGPGHSLLYSTLSLHTTSPPTHPPTHPPTPKHPSYIYMV